MTERIPSDAQLVIDKFPELDSVGLPAALAGTCWMRWFPQDSPVKEFGILPPRGKSLRGFLKYADWMDAKNPCGGKGVYIWLVPRPEGSNGWRFIHVGMSTSSMLRRTQDHCLNQFRPGGTQGEWCCKDRIYGLSLMRTEDGFGSLGTALWDGDAFKHGEPEPPGEEDRFKAAKEFLKKLRVLYLTPHDDASASNEDAGERIQWLEAVIAIAAARWLDPDLHDDHSKDKSTETTNTFKGKMASLRKSPISDQALGAVVVWLNNIEPMLPERRRTKP